MGGCTSFKRKSICDRRTEIAPIIHHQRPIIPQQNHYYPPSGIFYGPKSRFATYIRPTPSIYPQFPQYDHSLNRTNAFQARPSQGKGTKIKRRLNRNNAAGSVHAIEERSPTRRYIQYGPQELKVDGEHTSAFSQQAKAFNSLSAKKPASIDCLQDFTCFIENVSRVAMAQEGEFRPTDMATVEATMLTLGGSSGTKMGSDSSFASNESEKIIKSVTFNDETEVFWLESSHIDESEVSNALASTRCSSLIHRRYLMMIQVIHGTRERMRVGHVVSKRIKNLALLPLWLLRLITRIFGSLSLHHSKLARSKGLPPSNSKRQRQTLTDFPEQQPPKISPKDTFLTTSQWLLHLTDSWIPLDVVKIT